MSVSYTFKTTLPKIPRHRRKNTGLRWTNLFQQPKVWIQHDDTRIGPFDMVPSGRMIPMGEHVSVGFELVKRRDTKTIKLHLREFQVARMWKRANRG